jgi:hypothetical protein
MLEVQLTMLGLLVLRSLVLLIEAVCIQTLCLFKTYSYYNPTKNLNYNYEKNYSHINNHNEIMFYT